jgi:DNA-binding SARP family transcriptional activator
LSKSLHILCYIASRRTHRSPKDTLVELFWPDADADTIAKNFHPMISHVRKALNRDQMIKKDFIQYREGAYLLNAQYRYQIDTEEFERLLSDAREKRQSGEAEVAERMTAEAVRLYRGDFLEELYYDWAEELRTYYRDLYLEALKELASYYAERGDDELVIRYGQTILQRDPYREDIHCQVMEAHVRMGNRAAAIELFDKLRKMLRSELGVGPLPATVARYESLIK